MNLHLVKNTGNISLETFKSCKQTLACALVCLLDLQLAREIFPVFLTKGGVIYIYQFILPFFPIAKLDIFMKESFLTNTEQYPGT